MAPPSGEKQQLAYVVAVTVAAASPMAAQCVSAGPCVALPGFEHAAASPLSVELPDEDPEAPLEDELAPEELEPEEDAPDDVSVEASSPPPPPPLLLDEQAERTTPTVAVTIPIERAHFAAFSDSRLFGIVFSRAVCRVKACSSLRMRLAALSSHRLSRPCGMLSQPRHTRHRWDRAAIRPTSGSRRTHHF